MEEEALSLIAGVRTWNLRTRRALVAGDKGVRIDERRGDGRRLSLSPLRMKLPKLRGLLLRFENLIKFWVLFCIILLVN